MATVLFGVFFSRLSFRYLSLVSSLLPDRIKRTILPDLNRAIVFRGRRRKAKQPNTTEAYAIIKKSK